MKLIGRFGARLRRCGIMALRLFCTQKIGVRFLVAALLVLGGNVLKALNFFGGCVLKFSSYHRPPRL